MRHYLSSQSSKRTPFTRSDTLHLRPCAVANRRQPRSQANIRDKVEVKFLWIRKTQERQANIKAKHRMLGGQKVLVNPEYTHYTASINDISGRLAKALEMSDRAAGEGTSDASSLVSVHDRIPETAAEGVDLPDERTETTIPLNTVADMVPASERVGISSKCKGPPCHRCKCIKNNVQCSVR